TRSKSCRTPARITCTRVRTPCARDRTTGTAATTTCSDVQSPRAADGEAVVVVDAPGNGRGLTVETSRCCSRSRDTRRAPTNLRPQYVELTYSTRTTPRELGAWMN